jgi:hypothetical protein
VFGAAVLFALEHYKTVLEAIPEKESSDLVRNVKAALAFLPSGLLSALLFLLFAVGLAIFSKRLCDNYYKACKAKEADFEKDKTVRLSRHLELHGAALDNVTVSAKEFLATTCHLFGSASTIEEAYPRVCDGFGLNGADADKRKFVKTLVGICLASGVMEPVRIFYQGEGVSISGGRTGYKISGLGGEAMAIPWRNPALVRGRTTSSPSPSG